MDGCFSLAFSTLWRRFEAETPGIDMKTRSVAPVLKVANIGKALAYYKDVLGFEESFRVANYAGVRLGNVELHLAEQTEPADPEYTKPIGGSTVYIFCDDVNHYYSEIQHRGALVMFAPKDWPYGMRDFRVRDVDGNHISFGSELLGS